MNSGRVFRVVWLVVNSILLGSLLFLPWAMLREYSARTYLQGFVDGVVPLEGSSQQKVEAILAWLRNPPPRLHPSPEGIPSGYRNPVAFLHYARLLKVCGTSVSVFVSLADRAGFEARRLLLLNDKGETMHAVAEVRIEGRWVVADTSYRTLMHDAQGRLLSKEDLRDPGVFREATRDISGYDPANRYDRTRHVRLAKIPVLGNLGRKSLDSLFPGWDGYPFLSLLLSRASLELVLITLILLVWSVLARLALGWYGVKHCGLRRARLRDRLLRAWAASLSSPV